MPIPLCGVATISSLSAFTYQYQKPSSPLETVDLHPLRASFVWHTCSLREELPHFDVIDLNVGHGARGRVRRVDLCLRLKDPVHGSVRTRLVEVPIVVPVEDENWP